MKILYIAPLYYPHIGGLEHVVKSVAERLVRLGCEVLVLAGEPSIDKPVEEFINGVRVVRWPVLSPGGAYHFPKKRRDLKNMLKELAGNADVVHIHSVHSVFSMLAGLALADAPYNIKIVVTPHYHGTGHTYMRKLLWLLWRRRVSKLLSRASVVHAVSSREASLLLNHYPHVRGKVAIVPNGVDEDVYRYRWQGGHSDYMIYAGRIEKYKRLEVAVDVAREMGLKLLIIGRGPYREKLVKYANKVYKGGVEFLEPQPREKYLELISQARYAINPSKQEAFGIFIAEALAIGTPAIISKEIAENIGAQIKPLSKDLVVTESAMIKTWSDVLKVYFKELYAV